MNQQMQNSYLRTRVQTASKDQLLLMLFDGAIRFTEQAKVELPEKNYEASCTLLCKAKKIVIELITAIDRDQMDPEIYNNLVGLYNFIYQNLSEGNLLRKVEPLDQALPILHHLRDTWAMAIEGLAVADRQALSPTQISGLSFTG